MEVSDEYRRQRTLTIFENDVALYGEDQARRPLDLSGRLVAFAEEPVAEPLGEHRQAALSRR